MMPGESPNNSYYVLSERTLQALLWSLIALALLLRFVGLGHLPGVNGDEAYLGTKVLLFTQGDDISVRTGSNLFPDPLSFGLSWLVHLFAPVSFFTLRLPSAISGVLAVGVSFLLFRRLWGNRTALCIAALIAALPVHIAYSRFFWEPAQTPLVAVFAVYAAFRGKPLLTGVAAGVAVLVHPTNLFLLPVLAVALIARMDAEPSNWLTRLRDPRSPVWPVSGVLIVIGLIALLSGKQVLAGLNLGERILLHFGQVEQVWLFMTRHTGLLNGITTYTYVTGALNDTLVLWSHLGFVMFFWLPVAAAFWPGRHRDLSVLGAGTALALLLFHGIAGPIALRPNLERYGLWMTVPHCVLLGLALNTLGERMARKWFAPVAVGAIASLLLVQMHFGYFDRLLTNNSQSENAFMTGEYEPKEYAFEWILAHRENTRTTRILAEDWWTYWAFKYLSLEHTGFEVGLATEYWDRRFPRDAQLEQINPRSTEIFYAGYYGGPLGGWLPTDLNRSLRSTQKLVCPDRP
jgi:4-amino-4-deoxy-L-arabinose transferase-like glycosyltransferase